MLVYAIGIYIDARIQLTSLCHHSLSFACLHNLDFPTPLTFAWALSLRMYKIKGGAHLRSSCPTSSRSSPAMNADQALELLLDGTADELHSEDELEIDEDIAFPLPAHEESDQSEFEGKL